MQDQSNRVNSTDFDGKSPIKPPHMLRAGRAAEHAKSAHPARASAAQTHEDAESQSVLPGHDERPNESAGALPDTGSDNSCGSGTEMADAVAEQHVDKPTSSGAPSQSDEVERLQAQVDHLQQRLAKAQQSAALGELLSTTTHEFNNVLTTIINYAKLGMRHRDAPMRDKAFDKILGAGERAARITHSVLGMARNRSHEFEATSLKSLVEESLVLLGREMNKYRIQVELELTQVPPVMAIGNQIQQVLLNLLINARQAMPQGGRLIIRLGFDSESNTVEMFVRDFGCGIAPDKLVKIFDPYFSTKDGPDDSGKGGTGLGLASCKEIIEQHRGKIRVESTVGKGTAFTIRLPVAPDNRESHSKRARDDKADV